MQNVLFIMRYYIDGQKDNLHAKFSGQIKAAEKLGYNVWYTGCTNNELYICNEGKGRVKISAISKTNPIILQKIYFYNLLYKSVIEFFEKSEVCFDFVYARNMFYCNNSMKLLKEFKKRNIKIIMEIPTYPVKSEIEINKSFIKRNILLLIHIMSKRHSKYVDLYTIIGESCNGQYFGKNAINIENGVEIENIDRKIPKINKSQFHILTLATMSNWHGYDRLIIGLYNYYKNGGKEKIFIHMVGNDGDGSLIRWKKLSKDLNLNSYITFEGFKTGNELNEIINKCDIAIASLAGHRKNILSTSEMKSREYMARGIPFVYATNDYILEQVPEYCYKVKSDDSPICFESALNFIRKTRNKRNIIKDMRNYARNMSWEKQLKKIVNNISEVNNET